jgi:hypothetical protein
MVIPIPWRLIAVNVVRFAIKKCHLILQNGLVIPGIFVKVSTLEFRSLFIYFIYSLHTVDQIPRTPFYLDKDFADIFTDHT